MNINGQIPKSKPIFNNLLYFHKTTTKKEKTENYTISLSCIAIANNTHQQLLPEAYIKALKTEWCGPNLVLSNMTSLSQQFKLNSYHLSNTIHKKSLYHLGKTAINDYYELLCQKSSLLIWNGQNSGVIFTYIINPCKTYLQFGGGSNVISASSFWILKRKKKTEVRVDFSSLW